MDTLRPTSPNSHPGPHCPGSVAPDSPLQDQMILPSRHEIVKCNTSAVDGDVTYVRLR